MDQVDVYLRFALPHYRDKDPAHDGAHVRRIDVEAAFDSLYRHAHTPERLEEELVHDANALEVVGAFGLAKTFLKGGYEKQSYERTITIYRDCLDQVRFFTPGAKAQAQRLREYAKEFLENFENGAMVLFEEDAPGPV